MAAELTDARRTTLTALADALVPGGEGMPSASDAGVPSRWIDRALEARPDLADALAATLDAAVGEDAPTFLAHLEADEPGVLETLQLLVAGAYFMSPRTRRALDYPGQTQQPVLPGEAEYYEPEKLLRPVRERGTVYTAVDDAAME
jgi:hypothetical protein